MRKYRSVNRHYKLKQYIAHTHTHTHERDRERKLSGVYICIGRYFLEIAFIKYNKLSPFVDVIWLFPCEFILSLPLLWKPLFLG